MCLSRQKFQKCLIFIIVKSITLSGKSGLLLSLLLLECRWQLPLILFALFGDVFYKPVSFAVDKTLYDPKFVHLDVCGIAGTQRNVLLDFRFYIFKFYIGLYVVMMIMCTKRRTFYFTAH
jgi:hypothetical protein